MSYAEVAASGPTQSPEEARAPPVPSIRSDESEVASLIDVDSPHVSSVRSDFQEQTYQTDTQVERMERETHDEIRHQEMRAESLAKEAREKAEKASEKASEKAKKAKSAAKAEGKKLQENSDNPVYLANTLIWTIGAIALGVGAYQKHTQGKLDGKLVGTTVAAVGAFAVADYFATSWLLENKYPPK